MGERFDGFILVDIETTGLVPKDGHVLELGMAYYSPQLEMRDMFQSLVLSKTALSFIEDGWSRDDFAYKMHDSSGLLADLDALGKPGPEVDPENVARSAMHWLTNCGVNSAMKVPMTGNSVHFDKEWLTYHMPDLAKMFGYRTIDASSMREYVRVVAPDVFNKIEKELKPRGDHRVTPDILDTVDLLLALRQHSAIIS